MQSYCNSYDEVYEYIYIKFGHSLVTTKFSRGEISDAGSNHEAHEYEFQKISKSDLLFEVVFSS